MSFQLSVLKILAGQPEGRASLAVLKDYLAVFYTSGPEWTARMKRLAERVPDLDIFRQKLVARESGHWIIMEEGRAFLDSLEQAAILATQERAREEESEKLVASKLPVLSPAPQRRNGRRRHCRRRQPMEREGRSA
ncbi:MULTISPECIES: hypothetical protein [Bradyrhizobium]|uniref:Uncharacterized protein n=1 Tax=Bradyrhizobium xenonodulans TaxID=2736875 RepID=A0ABY7MI62_9BRAD|nr:hypothetical protein [Bradyrhizobium xenonodulans]WBL78113.1 hypothetical protein I3J27_35080 [Bradyrhizobium xenonodulans]